MNHYLLSRLLQTSELLPDKVAVVEGNRRTTYAQITASVSKLAAHLASQIAVGDRVALLLDNSAEYVIGCYAIWAAGGVVVGLNTALKATDLVNLVTHCEASVLIADTQHRELPKLLANDLCIQQLILIGENANVTDAASWSDIMATEIEQTVFASFHDQQPAAIIYTSGTTGHPKGVVLSHGNLAANVMAIQEYLPIREDDSVMCVLPFFYSYGNSVLHSHITIGACLVLENSFMYPHKVMERMMAEKVTAFSGVPSTYYLLLARTALKDYDLASLRYCTQAGGPMDKHKLESFLERVPDTRFYVMYGQTEASARLTYLPPDKLQDKLGSVGIPIPGVELSIRNESGEQLPDGQHGEVCARGANVMLGYWRDDEETAKVKRQDWLYTGDVGYVDEDGYYFLTGRNKEMIKSGAHRISPREIEELISQVQGVVEVAVVGVDDEVMGQLVKACVVADEVDEQLKKSIQRLCREKLALYKVPKVVEFYTELPKTASGKVRKHLLI